MSSQRNSSTRFGKGSVNGTLGRGVSGQIVSGTFQKTYGGGLVSLGTAKKPRAASTFSERRLAVPKPVNLPSLRKENAGNDPNTQLVPSGGGGGWHKQEIREEFSDETSIIAAGSSWATAASNGVPSWQPPRNFTVASGSQSKSRSLNPLEYPSLSAATTKQPNVFQHQPVPEIAVAQSGGNWDEDERKPSHFGKHDSWADDVDDHRVYGYSGHWDMYGRGYPHNDDLSLFPPSPPTGNILNNVVEVTEEEAEAEKRAFDEEIERVLNEEKRKQREAEAARLAAAASEQEREVCEASSQVKIESTGVDAIKDKVYAPIDMMEKCKSNEMTKERLLALRQQRELEAKEHETKCKEAAAEKLRQLEERIARKEAAAEAALKAANIDNPNTTSGKLSVFQKGGTVVPCVSGGDNAPKSIWLRKPKSDDDTAIKKDVDSHVSPKLRKLMDSANGQSPKSNENNKKLDAELLGWQSPAFNGQDNNCVQKGEEQIMELSQEGSDMDNNADLFGPKYLKDGKWKSNVKEKDVSLKDGTRVRTNRFGGKNVRSRTSRGNISHVGSRNEDGYISDGSSQALTFGKSDPLPSSNIVPAGGSRSHNPSYPVEGPNVLDRLMSGLGDMNVSTVLNRPPQTGPDSQRSSNVMDLPPGMGLDTDILFGGKTVPIAWNNKQCATGMKQFPDMNFGIYEEEKRFDSRSAILANKAGAEQKGFFLPQNDAGGDRIVDQPRGGSRSGAVGRPRSLKPEKLSSDGLPILPNDLSLDDLSSNNVGGDDHLMPSANNNVHQAPINFGLLPSHALAPVGSFSGVLFSAHNPWNQQTTSSNVHSGVGTLESLPISHSQANHQAPTNIMSMNLDSDYSGSRGGLTFGAFTSASPTHKFGAIASNMLPSNTNRPISNDLSFNMYGEPFVPTGKQPDWSVGSIAGSSKLYKHDSYPALDLANNVLKDNVKAVPQGIIDDVNINQLSSLNASSQIPSMTFRSSTAWGATPAPPGLHNPTSDTSPTAVANNNVHISAPMHLQSNQSVNFQSLPPGLHVPPFVPSNHTNTSANMLPNTPPEIATTLAGKDRTGIVDPDASIGGAQSSEATTPSANSLAHINSDGGRHRGIRASKSNAVSHANNSLKSLRKGHLVTGSIAASATLSASGSSANASLISSTSFGVADTNIHVNALTSNATRLPVKNQKSLATSVDNQARQSGHVRGNKSGRNANKGNTNANTVTTA